MQSAKLIVGLTSLCLITATYGLAEEITVTAEESVAGITVQDRSQAHIDVRFVSPFKKLASSDGDDVIMTVSSPITTMQIVQLLGRVKIDAAAGDPGSSGEKGFEDTFGESYAAVMEDMNLCQGSRITPGAKVPQILEDCANYYPAEYTVAVNQFQAYTTWKAGEESSLIDLYLAKPNSKNLKERIEGRLMTQCLSREVGTGDAVELASALSRCALPQNWKLNTLFDMIDYSDCDAEGSEFGPETYEDFLVITDQQRNDGSLTEYTFDLPTYIKHCVVTKDRAFRNTDGSIPSGIEIAIQLIPFARLELVKPDGSFNIGDDIPETTFEIRTYPMSLSNEQLQAALYTRIFKFISSKEFLEGATDGWVPSPFAPDDLSTDDENWRDYCSIRLPITFLQHVNMAAKSAGEIQVGSTAGSTYTDKSIQFLWKTIASRIATIQALEVLLGSAQISQEAERLLGITDAEMHRLIEPTITYTTLAAKSYRDSIDLAYATTLEDVVRSMDMLMVNLIEVKEKTNGVLDTARRLSD